MTLGVSNSQCATWSLQYFSEMSSTDKIKRCSYKKITEDMRTEIIERILQNGESIRDVAHDMNVNISTCKAIIKVYQEEGRVGKKKRRNKVYNVIETFSFFTIDGSQIQQLGDIKIDQSKVSLERDQDFDKYLEDEARAKAEKMLQGVVEERKKVEETASQYQNQLMQFYLMQNGYMQYMSQPLLNLPYSEVKAQDMESFSYRNSGSSSSDFNGEPRNE